MKHTLLLILFSAVFLFSSTRGINLPYVGFHAFNFNIYSLIAHNYNAFGFFATKFAPVISAQETIPKQPLYYFHHPPMVSIVLAIFFRLFGEEYWVGRMVMILFSCASLFLIYKIGALRWGKSVGITAFVIASLLPAFSLFGRMINMEPLVLFFLLMSCLLVSLYEKQEKVWYLCLLVVSVILGTLSDWSMTYGIFALALYVLYTRKYRVALILLTTTTLTALFYILYTAILQHGFEDLLSAISVRAVGEELPTVWYWPVLWVLTITTRLAVYFNPFIVLSSGMFVVRTLSQIRKEKMTKNTVFVASLFLFAVLHVVLFLAGSFGHPYWTFFFIPPIIFSSAAILVKKPLWVFILLCFVSIPYLFKLERWKTGDVRANIWRYELTTKANSYLDPYEKVGLNMDPALDADTLRYVYLHDIEFTPQVKIREKTWDSYIYSCEGECIKDRENILSLLQRYPCEGLKTDRGRVFVFASQQKNKGYSSENCFHLIPNEQQEAMVGKESAQKSFFARLYLFFITHLGVQQL